MIPLLVVDLLFEFSNVAGHLLHRVEVQQLKRTKPDERLAIREIVLAASTESQIVFPRERERDAPSLAKFVLKTPF